MAERRFAIPSASRRQPSTMLRARILAPMLPDEAADVLRQRHGKVVPRGERPQRRHGLLRSRCVEGREARRLRAPGMRPPCVQRAGQQRVGLGRRHDPLHQRSVGGVAVEVNPESLPLQ